jgi:hypothetical protein
MKLHEEYIRRHKLNIPVIRFDNRSSLFLKTKDAPFAWSIFNIIWRSQSGRPGFYEFVRMEPLHNGQGAFNCKDKHNYVYWEQYEFEVEKVISEYRNDGYYSVSSKNRSLMAWEMFLYMYDGWLAKKMDSKFYQQVELSTFGTDFNEKSNAYRVAVKMLDDCYGSQELLDMLNYQIRPMINGHSQWLEDLVNV